MQNAKSFLNGTTPSLFSLRKYSTQSRLYPSAKPNNDAISRPLLYVKLRALNKGAPSDGFVRALYTPTPPNSRRSDELTHSVCSCQTTPCMRFPRIAVLNTLFRLPFGYTRRH
ncbi:hypothetical protein PHSY_004312 [Pseudozyma hubeiensis SY62]|uniref:Uncharacterized protein n=1 Tax=Pseudozyma hubeiensis (strain SY62) TaxID=1305764 RepID=R9P5N7_PSEHS|nr:hypothetical protein PHSY_004312 [Pseudozyma hubeiensis SY62]GAC96728.1 hypothetical protein PHSY_004312 [Pseudozyma hubeiensis SY62]